MIEHDKVVGAMLDRLDALGMAEDTIVAYSTDNGPHMNTWPDAGMTPLSTFRVMATYSHCGSTIGRSSLWNRKSSWLWRWTRVETVAFTPRYDRTVALSP
jgi:arylsulfatase A-like enzyme